MCTFAQQEANSFNQRHVTFFRGVSHSVIDMEQIVAECSSLLMDWNLVTFSAMPLHSGRRIRRPQILATPHTFCPENLTHQDS